MKNTQFQQEEIKHSSFSLGNCGWVTDNHTMNSNLFSAYSACGFARVLIVSETENDFHLIQPKP